MRAQICLKISVRHSFGPVIILRGYDFFLVLLWNTDFFCTEFHWKRARDTNMPDKNFFATNTLACGTKNLAANSGRPWMIHARTLHYSYFKLFIICTILQRTPTILLHREQIVLNNGMQHTDYTPSATLFPSITSVCVCVTVIDNTVFQLCIVWVNHLCRPIAIG